MSTLLDGISKIRRHLLKPKDGAPNTDSILGELIEEQRNFMNELVNSSVLWTYQEWTITPNGQDVLIPYDLGKIWFVRTSDPYNSIPVEFTDYRDASTDWWWYQPIAASRPQDYGYGWGLNNKIAFYYKDGSLYAKMPLPYIDVPLVITAAAGVWEPDLSTQGVLKQYHHLPEIRASINLLPGAEWDSDGDRKRSGLADTLPIQEGRVYEQFIVAKRSITGETITYGEPSMYF